MNEEYIAALEAENSALREAIEAMLHGKRMPPGMPDLYPEEQHAQELVGRPKPNRRRSTRKDATVYKAIGDALDHSSLAMAGLENEPVGPQTPGGIRAQLLMAIDRLREAEQELRQDGV